MTRLRFAFGLALLLAAGTLRADDSRVTTVGMPGRIDGLVLPGSELEVKPLDNPRAPVVLRIIAVYRHGTAHRYDFVYYGLDPGTFDLKDYLRRKDGSSTADLPSLRVKVEPVLPPGQVQPNPLEPRRAPWLGGYRLLAVLAGVLWVLGLLAILFARRRKKGMHTAGARPLTLAERLRPMVEGALAGRLTEAERATLERTLLAFWRRRLHLESLKPAEAIAVLRRHADAGPLLEQLEVWLHRPGTADQVDVTALLRPYQELPAEALETAGSRESS
jgi:hypothetical protein